MADSRTVWVSGYISSGLKVSLTFALTGETPDEQIESARALLALLPKLGLLTTEPGLNPGEKHEDIGALVYRQYARQDGQLAFLVDAYGADDRLQWRLFSQYINSPEQAAAIEVATGVNLKEAPIYKSKIALQRNEHDFAEFARRVKPRTRAVMVKNPDYNPEGKTAIERGAEWKFERWDGAAAALSTPDEPTTKPAIPAQGTIIDTTLNHGKSERPAFQSFITRVVYGETRNVKGTTTAVIVFKGVAADGKDVNIVSFTRKPLENHVSPEFYDKLRTAGMHQLPVPVEVVYDDKRTVVAINVAPLQEAA